MHDTDHTEFQDRLPGFKSGALDDVEWLMVRTHLAECAQCQAEMRRPELLNRAAPKRIDPEHPRHPARTTAPLWTLALGVALVVALVTSAVVFALTS
ncbi:zf-HC2 domain-containing protein [Saccharopolyspora griseoalba]|uniref:Zf-HC2 domain-containing protein n=1 Tax=Saccharopolyspora griseoalba TaxID=1431848 RepID=A0ABW2LE96_9PSEU